MPVFTVGVHQTYTVEIEAQSIDDAISAAQFVSAVDSSWESEREERGFNIAKITLSEHDAFEVS